MWDPVTRIISPDPSSKEDDGSSCSSMLEISSSTSSLMSPALLSETSLHNKYCIYEHFVDSILGQHLSLLKKLSALDHSTCSIVVFNCRRTFLLHIPLHEYESYLFVVDDRFYLGSAPFLAFPAMWFIICRDIQVSQIIKYWNVDLLFCYGALTLILILR